MLNKKKLGLGMLVTGGVLAVTGAILTRKGIQIEKEAAIEEELCDLVNDECTDEYEDKEADIEEEFSINATLNTEVPPIPKEWEPNAENVRKARVSTNTYNPTAQPVSISQEELEAMSHEDMLAMTSF